MLRARLATTAALITALISAPSAAIAAPPDADSTRLE
jgi:hypothetical protein